MLESTRCALSGCGPHTFLCSECVTLSYVAATSSEAVTARDLHCRVIDPEREGDLAQQQYNKEVEALHDYLQRKGRGYAGFRQPSPVYTIQ